MRVHLCYGSGWICYGCVGEQVLPLLVRYLSVHWYSEFAVCAPGYIFVLKGLSHEIFGPVFWAVWMYLGLNVNRLWFLNFNYAPLILDNYFMF